MNVRFLFEKTRLYISNRDRFVQLGGLPHSSFSHSLSVLPTLTDGYSGFKRQCGRALAESLYGKDPTSDIL